MEVELLSASDSDLKLRTRRFIIPGSAVEVLTPRGIVFGKVWFATETNREGAEFEIDVDVREILSRAETPDSHFSVSSVDDELQEFLSGA